MRIAVDVMGSDYGPKEVIAGALHWIQEKPNQILLVGTEELIKEELRQMDYDAALVKVVNASQVIEMNESPALALRRKKDASIVVATKLVKENKADAVISCGSTGGQMAAAIFILGRLAGIERPPIITSIPAINNQSTLLIDVGANVDCKPKQLVQFALLAKVYSNSILGIDNPRIAILNNGTEEGKGNSQTLETYQLLQAQAGLNFIGNIEGRGIFNHQSDVIVCDGFVGNIVLKAIEGLAGFIAGNIMQETGALPKFFKQLDYTQVGGAPLMGIDGISIVCHGSSKREAVYNGIKVAEHCFKEQLVALQREELLNYEF